MRWIWDILTAPFRPRVQLWQGSWTAHYLHYLQRVPEYALRMHMETEH